MIEPATPANEDARLAVLRGMNILDTPPEAHLDRVTEIAAQLFGVPIALISLVDEKRQWFKARHGLEARETPRKVSFCGHAILEQEILCVPDARRDPRFADNPLVTGEPFIRFYAGKPLCAAGGEALGTLCLIDTKPREFSDADHRLLNSLAECAEQMLALRENVSATTSGKSWRVGVLVTVLAAALFEFLSSQLIFIPNPPAILIAAVVFAAFHGGMRAGLISAAIAWLYIAHFFSIPGRPFHYAQDNLLRVLVWAVATPAIVVMTGLMKRRSERLLEISKVNGHLATLLVERTAAIVDIDENNRQNRAIIDSAPTQFAYYDKDMRCRYSNASYAQWFGLAANQIAGKHAREILGEAAFAEIEPYLRRVTSGEKVQYEGPRMHADGRMRTTDAYLTPRIDNDGRISGFYAFFNDITERKRSEEAARRSQERLERALDGSRLALF